VEASDTRCSGDVRCMRDYSVQLSLGLWQMRFRRMHRLLQGKIHVTFDILSIKRLGII